MPIRFVTPFHYVGPSRAVRVGVTGGIGAGKTTVTRALADLGASVISSDDIARDLQGPGGAAVEPIRARFGDDVIAEDGSVDRARLAGVVFRDDRARTDLERLIHPLIAREAHDFFARAEAGSIAVYDIPLLVETGAEDYFDAIVVVWADIATRLERLRRDRQMTTADAMARIAVQASDAERERSAHAIVTNTGRPADTAEAVRGELWPALLALTGRDN
nr:dephospho-CoA kinase [Nanchangia anserum]